MKTRVISALVALAVLITLYFAFDQMGLVFICSMTTLLCVLEFYKLADKILPLSESSKVLMPIVTLLNFSALAFFPDKSLPFLASSFIVVSSFLILQIAREEDRLNSVFALALNLVGIIYVGIFPALITRLVLNPSGPQLLLILLGIVFAGDTFAYFVGRRLGKTKLSPLVSPNKTREGSFGGLLGSLILGVGLFRWAYPQVGVGSSIFISLAVGASAQMGDLFESLLKRLAQVKDSGRLMPGHGGALDRVDGVFFGAPIFYILVYIWAT